MSVQKAFDVHGTRDAKPGSGRERRGRLGPRAGLQEGDLPRRDRVHSGDEVRAPHGSDRARAKRLDAGAGAARLEAQRE